MYYCKYSLFLCLGTFPRLSKLIFRHALLYHWRFNDSTDVMEVCDGWKMEFLGPMMQIIPCSDQHCTAIIGNFVGTAICSVWLRCPLSFIVHVIFSSRLAEIEGFVNPLIFELLAPKWTCIPSQRTAGPFSYHISLRSSFFLQQNLGFATFCP